MSSIFKRAVHFVEVDPLEDGSRPTFLVNHDLLPVPIEERKWGVVNFVTFWVADSANVVRLSLSYRQLLIRRRDSVCAAVPTARITLLTRCFSSFFSSPPS